MEDTTVLEPEVRTRVHPAPRWNVVLLDDDDHSYEYVIDMLGRLFGYGVPTAFAMAREVDGTGRVVVFTSHRELAELKQDLVQGFGADPRIPGCKGSMSALLEPVD